LPGVTLAAVCDTSAGRAKALAEEWGIPSVYTSLDEMVEREKLRVIHVLTPPQSHVKLAMECIQSGCDVFVEKPLGVSVAECRTLTEAAARAGRVIGVNHQLTYAPALIELMETIRSRKLGRVNHAIMTFTVVASNVPERDSSHFMFQSFGNMMLEAGPHPFSVIRRLMGKLRAMSTFVSGEVKITGGKSYYRNWLCSMVCERGTAQLHISFAAGTKDVTVHVLGQDATAIADLKRNTVHLYEATPYRITGDVREAWRNAKRTVGATAGELFSQYATKMKLKPTGTGNMHYSSMSTFYRAYAAGRPGPETGDSGLAVVEYCEQSAKSAIVTDA
jgi:predicted dehydrogenase